LLENEKGPKSYNTTVNADKKQDVENDIFDKIQQQVFA
jgi:hypothetical protein